MNTTQEKKHGWMLMGSMFAMQIAITGFMFGPLSLFADPICEEWGILRSQFAVVVTMGTLLNALISMTVYGPLEKRFGVKLLMIAGGVLTCGGFAVMAISSGLVLLYLGGAMFGVGAAFLSNNTINTVIIRRFACKQGTMQGIIRMIGSLSSTFGSAVVGMWIYDASIGWRVALGIITVIGVICFIAWTLLYRGDPEDLGERPMYIDQLNNKGAGKEAYVYGPSVSQTRRTPQFYLLALNYLLVGFTCFAVVTTFALFCVDYGYSEASGTALSMLWLAAAVLSIPGGMICDKMGTKALLALCSVCVIIAAIMFLSPALPLPLIFLAAVLLGFGYVQGLVPVGISVREAFGTRDYSQKIGLAVGFQIGGASLAPIIMNLFYDFGGHTYSLALIVVVVCCIASGVLGFITTRKAYN